MKHFFEKISNLHTYKAYIAIVGLTGLAFTSCTEDDSAYGNVKSDVLAFNVKNAQEATYAFNNGVPSSRAFFDGQFVQPEGQPEASSVTQIISVGDSCHADMGELCMVETTATGIQDETSSVLQTRANIATAITANFSTFGYSGASEDAINTLWFYNEETTSTGELATKISWTKARPYGLFYGISPQVTSANSNLTIFPENYQGMPYLNYEVAKNVTAQKDLMTACSGAVRHDASGTLSRVDLNFYHALTAVRFKVGKNLSYSKTINKIELIGAKSKGKFTLSTKANENGSWSDISAPTTFTLDGLNVSTAGNVGDMLIGKDNDNCTFYMLPQELEGVSAKIYFADGTSLSANLTGTWKAGTTVTYSLSEKNSDWVYTFEVTDPDDAAYNQNKTSEFNVQSYRKDAKTGEIQPVAWEVVGYSTDGVNYGMDRKPDWLLNLKDASGNVIKDGLGTATADGKYAAYAELKTDGIIDLKARRNKQLNDEPAKGSKAYPFNLAKRSDGKESTANCYIIRAKGFYKIPLVYGNGLNSGAYNLRAYESTYIKPNTLHDFVDHKNRKITNPWINKHLQNADGNNTSCVDRAVFLWRISTTNIVNPTIDGDYLTFEVREPLYCGNALIAVYQGKDVVWTYHLWVTTEDSYGRVYCGNDETTRENLYFMNEPLGWVYTNWQGTSYTVPRFVHVKLQQKVGNNSKPLTKEITITQKPGFKYKIGYGTLYQFGRMTPFRGNVSNSFTDETADLGLAIQRPLTVYKNAKYDVYYNLWSIEEDKYGYGVKTVAKTIYDPCPYGFAMPKSNTMEKMSFSKSYWDNGLYFKANNKDYLYFNKASYVDDNGLTNANNAENVYYWLAAPGENNQGAVMEISSTGVKRKVSRARNHLYSVRPLHVD